MNWMIFAMANPICFTILAVASMFTLVVLFLLFTR
jgi:hypothetical protein